MPVKSRKNFVGWNKESRKAGKQDGRNELFFPRSAAKEHEAGGRLKNVERGTWNVEGKKVLGKFRCSSQ